MSGLRDLVRPPPSRVRNIAHDRLPALVDGHVMHRDLLLAAGPVALERLHLSRKRARQLVEGALGTVLLDDVAIWARRRAKIIVAMCTAAIWAPSMASISSRGSRPAMTDSMKLR